jgi:diacylglycerol diphosphate phosphatase/phosphatidate phosphatase
MHVFRPRTDLGRCLLALVPLLCALMIAISRLDDYRHDIYDVTCGSILGLLVAYFSYRRYYPSLRSSGCDNPYDKADSIESEGFAKLADDEEQQIPEHRPIPHTLEGEDSYSLEGPALPR